MKSKTKNEFLSLIIESYDIDDQDKVRNYLDKFTLYDIPAAE